jgi:poly-gamma-glutamate synthase PgsB/CapB
VNPALVITAVLVILVGLLFLEYRIHKRNLKSIPIRIHVNGTRGKSSVTRLIAAGLRTHGISTFAKTTGTLPRMITDDGTEYPIARPGGANIIEQVRVISFAAHHEAQALVIECMALQPFLQSLTELKLIQATHGVITNTRADHLEWMGPTERDVALSLLGSTPCRSKLFTCEHDYMDEFRTACADRNTDLVVVEDAEIRAVTDEEMQGFTYTEHKENVALALKVCASLGVPRETALEGMHKAAPDLGAMREFRLAFFGRELFFVNGFAANDPESSERIWRIALEKHERLEQKIMVVNTRADRVERSIQLAEAMPGWPPANRYFVIGSGTYQFVKTAMNRGIPPSKIVNAEGLSVERVFEETIRLSGRSALIMGIGNTASPGIELVTYFQNRAHFEQEEGVRPCPIS